MTGKGGTVTGQKRNELIATAALTQFAVGDCDGLFESDLRGQYDMSQDEMSTFLSQYSATIDQVADTLFQVVVTQVAISLP